MVLNRTFRSMRKVPEFMALETNVVAGHLLWPKHALSVDRAVTSKPCDVRQTLGRRPLRRNRPRNRASPPDRSRNYGSRPVCYAKGPSDSGGGR